MSARPSLDTLGRFERDAASERSRPPTRYSGAVEGREERVARNEATSREINERIEDAHEGAPPDKYLRVVCECGQESCDRLIAITLPEYERVRSDSSQFADELV